MPYRAEFAPGMGAIISGWSLSDFLLVEVHLRINESLPAGAPGNLVRATEPFDGMVYFFEMVDPQNRLANHVFVFHVLFAMDEQTLRVIDGVHVVEWAS